MIYSHQNLQWLKKQLWFWILLGIIIMSIFFYIANGLIVFIGGTALGMYLYNKFGEPKQKVGGKLFNNTVNSVKTMIFDNQPKVNEKFINEWGNFRY